MFRHHLVGREESLVWSWHSSPVPLEAGFGGYYLVGHPVHLRQGGEFLQCLDFQTIQLGGI